MRRALLCQHVNDDDGRSFHSSTHLRPGEGTKARLRRSSPLHIFLGQLHLLTIPPQTFSSHSSSPTEHFFECSNPPEGSGLWHMYAHASFTTPSVSSAGSNLRKSREQLGSPCLHCHGHVCGKHYLRGELLPEVVMRLSQAARVYTVPSPASLARTLWGVAGGVQSATSMVGPGAVVLASAGEATRRTAR